MQPNWATVLHLHEYIRATGLFDDDLSTFTQRFGPEMEVALDSAKAEFEKVTGRKPFKPDTTNVERLFNPPGAEAQPTGRTGGGRILFLDNGLTELHSLKVGVTADYAGTALTINRDFWMEPANAATEGDPWERVRFANRQFGQPYSIKITGKWGWPGGIPDDVFEAQKAGAAAALGPILQQAITGGMISWKEGDATVETYGDSPLEMFVTEHQRRFDRTVRRYMRALA